MEIDAKATPQCCSLICRTEKAVLRTCFRKTTAAQYETVPLGVMLLCEMCFSRDTELHHLGDQVLEGLAVGILQSVIDIGLDAVLEGIADLL